MAGQALPELRIDFHALLRRADEHIADRHIDYHPAGARRAHARQTIAGVDQHPGSRREKPFAHYVTGSNEKIFSIVLGAALAAVIAFGWIKREQSYLAPDHGLGYWLGIAALVTLPLLLIYPLRKRLKPMPLPAQDRLWFRAHTVLGLAGPTLVLFHANFRPGTGDGKLALMAMLMVAASGSVGRYLHGKVHLGRYGRKAAMREILADADSLRNLLGQRLPLSEPVVTELNRFVRIAMAPRSSLLVNVCWMPVLNLRTHAVRKRLQTQVRRLIKREAKRRGWSRRMRRQKLAAALELMSMHVAAVKKAAEFACYQRLLTIWRIVHVPLLLLLFLAAAKHLAAAHFH